MKPTSRPYSPYWLRHLALPALRFVGRIYLAALFIAASPFVLVAYALMAPHRPQSDTPTV